MKWFVRKMMIIMNRFMAKLLGTTRAKILLTRVYQGKTLNLSEPKKLNEKLLSAYYRGDEQHRYLWLRQAMEKITYDFENDKVALNAPSLVSKPFDKTQI